MGGIGRGGLFKPLLGWVEIHRGNGLMYVKLKKHAPSASNAEQRLQKSKWTPDPGVYNVDAAKTV